MIEVFLFLEDFAKPFLYPGHIGLGNRPHMLDNGPHLSLWDVLSLGSFCPLGHFVSGTFCLWDVLSLGTFLSVGRFVLRSFVFASSKAHL